MLDTYDYAVPEAGTMPLLGGNDDTLPVSRSRMSSVSSKGPRIPSRNSQVEGKKVSELGFYFFNNVFGFQEHI